jgi:uncharacterized lipoprotein YbaY
MVKGEGRPWPPFFSLLALAAVLAGPGCAKRVGVEQAFPGEVTGTVFYRESVSLPPEAELSVTLYEQAGGTAERRFVAAQLVQGPPGPPMRFRVAYPPGVIDPRAGYIVVARIEVGGKLWFENQEPVPVLTFGNPPRADVLVKRVAERSP